MPKRGFFFDLSDGIENNSNVHREIIRQIERMTGRNLVCYIANPGHPGGALQDHDPDLLENMLRSLRLKQYGEKLDVLVNSPADFLTRRARWSRYAEAWRLISAPLSSGAQ